MIKKKIIYAKFKSGTVQKCNVEHLRRQFVHLILGNCLKKKKKKVNTV